MEEEFSIDYYPCFSCASYCILDVFVVNKDKKIDVDKICSVCGTVNESALLSLEDLEGLKEIAENVVTINTTNGKLTLTKKDFNKMYEIIKNNIKNNNKIRFIMGMCGIRFL